MIPSGYNGEDELSGERGERRTRYMYRSPVWLVGTERWHNFSIHVDRALGHKIPTNMGSASRGQASTCTPTYTAHPDMHVPPALTRTLRRIFGMENTEKPDPFPMGSFIPPGVLFSVIRSPDHGDPTKLKLVHYRLVRGGIHDTLFLLFKSVPNQTLYGLVADRLPASRSMASSSSISLSSTNSGPSQASSSLAISVVDRVKGFHVPPEEKGRWWICGGGRSKDIVIIEEPIPSNPPITLLHVAAVLRAVSQHSPGYTLMKENCWYYARCSALLIVAAQTDVTDRKKLEELFLSRTTNMLPFPSKTMIAEDVQQIRELYDKTVRLTTHHHHRTILIFLVDGC
jgi:hypothetical protein